MEAAECHVTLQNALSQSGLLDRLNHCQRNKMAQVGGLAALASVNVVSYAPCSTCTHTHTRYTHTRARAHKL